MTGEGGKGKHRRVTEGKCSRCNCEATTHLHIGSQPVSCRPYETLKQKWRPPLCLCVRPSVPIPPQFSTATMAIKGLFYVFSQKIIPGRNPCFNARDVVLVCCKAASAATSPTVAYQFTHPKNKLCAQFPQEKARCGEEERNDESKKSPSSKPRRAGGKTLLNFCPPIRRVFYIASPSSFDQPPVSSGHMPLVPPLRILTQLTLYLYRFVNPCLKRGSSPSLRRREF